MALYPGELILPAPELYPSDALFTPATILGLELANNLAPWLTLALAWYADAIGAEFDQVATLVTQTGFDGDSDYVPPYGVIFNPGTTPYAFIPYLAQFEGQPIPITATESEAQELLLMAPNRNRGAQSALITAIEADLVGTQMLNLQPRHRPDGSLDADWFTMVIRPEELVVNLIPNGSFEHDTLGDTPAGWMAISAGSPILVANNAWSSAGSASASFTATSTAAQSLGATTATLTIVGDATYTAVAAINISAVPASGLYLQLQWYDGATPLSVSNSAAIMTTGIQTISVTAVAPSSANGVVVVLYTQASASGQTLTLDFDAVILQETSTTPVYVDGDTYNYEWTGAIGDSTTSVLPKLLADVQAVKPAGIQWYDSVAAFNMATELSTCPIVQTDSIIWSEATNSYEDEPDSLTWSKTTTVTP